ncbi:MAG TPA: fused MFS/spermidine synthase, partial [Syntrophobacteria bacterium]|nr:fused MFS/spermidine synthase [Syntrophobacteria bacterium]
MLEVIVFICGAVVMILEMVGSRILAPYLGTSIVIWTSLIGVILGCLSLGYWWGGRIADKKPDYR